MNRVKSLFVLNIIIFFTFSNSTKALEVIRDTELENFTDDIVKILLVESNMEEEDINIYFINSNQINAFVTGGKNIFINTELIIQAKDYREYAAVIAHELAHILGGHIFRTSEEISNISDKALPIYLLGMIGLITGATDAGFAGVMVGQAAVADTYTYYSRTQEASADQKAVSILCNSMIDGSYLASFLENLEASSLNIETKVENYRSTHPLPQDRISWIELALSKKEDCEFRIDEELEKRFNLLKAKLFGFTHTYKETKAVYNLNNTQGLYANAVSSYLNGDHKKSKENLKKLIEINDKNPFFKELIGEIYYVNQNYDEAIYFQENAINNLTENNDIYMMMLGNYLLSTEEKEKVERSINYFKQSIQLNSQNAYSWYLLAKAYAYLDDISLANYATAERYFLIGEKKLSYDFASKAMANIEKNTPEWYRTYDLIEILRKEVSTNEN
ncbi:M48 family metalloprotease [Pelagibacteraceae bacterium]|nr:M48 family metalloprotease [Pelagibacteraceae bacterium]